MVRLADDARTCVVYLGYPEAGNENRITPEGTGFLIGVDEATYLVTAGHVAEKLGADPFGIRMNRSDGSGRVDRIDSAKWYFHPDDKNIDIAVLEYAPPKWAKTMQFPRGSLLSEQKLESKNIGAGDLAYVVGVFHLLHGKERNLPVVHTGHVALMADDEPIPVKRWRKDQDEIVFVNGYLVAVQTLPGTSGSPVFVRRSLDVDVPVYDEVAVRGWLHGTVWLLGVWQGAWAGDPSEFLAVPKHEEVIVPVGMGVVIPAIRILEVIDQPELKASREKAQNEAAIYPE